MKGPDMKKVFVLDTNVLLHDPNAIFRFNDNDIIIPITVIEEIDNFKSEMNEIGRNARETGRNLDSLRAEGQLDTGVDLKSGGNLKISFCPTAYFDGMPRELSQIVADNRIIAVAHYYSTSVYGNSDVKVVFVSNDANARIKANAIGILSEVYHNDRVSIDTLFTGHSQLGVNGAQIDDLYKKDGDGCVRVSELEIISELGVITHDNSSVLFSPNECVTLVSSVDPKHSVLTRYDSSLDILCRITDITKDNAPSGLIPRNREQRFAMDLLLDPNIKLVTLIGKAGTGKTLMAIAAGLYGATETDTFDRVLVTRPVISLGKQDIGFLPGTLNEKMAPWMQPIWDNIEVILGKADNKILHKGSFDKEAGNMSPVDYLQAIGKLEVGALSFIRGRSIPKQYFIVDEAQNLTPHEVKTIITRAGEGTKIILTGDPYQIDNPYVDSSSNGLTYVAERFKNEKIAAHIILTKGERSELAELAAELL
jgi:PhoH-like ATPase